MACPVFILPGWQNSGPDHWQSLWQDRFGYRRIEQHDWMRPLRGDWIMRLEEELLACSQPAVLAAHSLGCIQVAAWAAHSRHPGRVRGALLVAPGDADHISLRELLPSWSPIPMLRLPFPTRLLASRDDPFCAFDRARVLAAAWGSELVDCGPLGHINADSGLGDWPQGHAHLLDLMRAEPPVPNQERD